MRKTRLHPSLPFVPRRLVFAAAVRPTPGVALLLTVAALAMPPLTRAAPQQPAISLVDATGLRLQTTRVQAEVDGPFVITTVDLAISALPEVGRALAAELQVPLAANERIQGHALDVAGTLRNAVAVERVQARSTFEDIVRRQVDPSLLEQAAGNSYRLQVFPVSPGQAPRQVQLRIASLAQRAACGWQARLPASVTAMRASAQVLFHGDAPVKARGLRRMAEPLSGSHSAWEVVVSGDGSASWCVPAGRGVQTWGADVAGVPGTVMAVPASRAPAAPRRLPSRLELVWDASLSMMQRPLARELNLLRRYLARRDTQVVLSVLRQRVVERQSFDVAKGDTAELEAHLRALAQDGASGLAHWTPAEGAGEVLMFTDATATWPGDGPTPTMSDRPVFVIGALRGGDPALAAWLARSGGDVIDLDTLDDAQAVQRLAQQSERLLLPPTDAAGGWDAPGLQQQGGAFWACHTGVPQGSTLPRLVLQRPNGRRDELATAAPAVASQAAAFWCATWKAQRLALAGSAQRAELVRLGVAMGLTTAETSLLVLESDADHVRHGVLPSDRDSELYSRVRVAMSRQVHQRVRDQDSARSALLRAWADRKAWWLRDHDAERAAAEAAKRAAAVEAMRGAAGAATAPAAAPESQRLASPRSAPTAPRVAAVAAVAAAPTPTASPATSSATVIRLQAPLATTPYRDALAGADDAAATYALYLDLRPDHLQRPSFYVDVAERLFALGAQGLAELVLSNVVEIAPHQHAVLRMVAQRLLQAGKGETAVQLLREARDLAPNEPQSHRNLGLALAHAGQCAAASDSLLHVIQGAWHSRFGDIAEITLADLHDLTGRCDTASALAKLDDSLREPLPVGLRVVLGWDLDSTDIDLYVTDPTGEVASFERRRTRQGGRMSRDFTAGYGPEEFVVRRPLPGSWRVEARYYGSSLPVLQREAVVEAQVTIRSANGERHEQSITARLITTRQAVPLGTVQVASEAGAER